jgi:hypothetical protein
MRIESWQVEMARRTPPEAAAFVQGSTPVISFGDVLTAEVATIGINPSRREFDDNGWLTGATRRLATLESLAAEPGLSLTYEQARQVVEDCNRYFLPSRNPYWRWFKRLDELLTRSIGTSYRDGTACHLDLVQWATDPIWGKLTDKAERRALLVEGRPHLERLLSESNVHLVLAAGRAVTTQLKRIGLVTWEEVDKIPLGATTCTLLRGTGEGISYVGWSTNVQSGWGVSNEFMEQLAESVAAVAGPVVTPDPTEGLEIGASGADIEPDAAGYLPAVVKVTGKQELADVLRRWYERSVAGTIGDVGRFGGRPCIAIELGDKRAVLNVDTKRTAVAAYLQHVELNGTDAPWQVVANARGTINKVLVTDDPADAAGWYVYLRKPLSAPMTL